MDNKKLAAPADLEALKALALAATPGKWRECGHDRGGCHCALIWATDRDELVAEAWKGDDMVPRTAVEPSVNAAYIAAASPAVVLALIDRIRMDEAEFKNFHRSLCSRFGYMHDDRHWKRDQVSLEEHIAGCIERADAHAEAIGYYWPDEKTGQLADSGDIKAAVKHGAKPFYGDHATVVATKPAALEALRVGQQAVPEQVSNALALAMTICDAVPTRAHDLADDESLRHIGKLVNCDTATGQHGYAVIRDAQAAFAKWRAHGTQQAARPDGFVLVPINPTPKMIDATFNDRVENESHNARNRRIYAAMLAAAPAPALLQEKAAPAEQKPVAWAVAEGGKFVHVTRFLSVAEDWLQYSIDRKLVALFDHPVPELAGLLIEARAVLETWKDVVPAVSLCADIDNVLAGRCRAQGGDTKPDSAELVSSGAPSAENVRDAALAEAKAAALGELVRVVGACTESYNEGVRDAASAIDELLAGRGSDDVREGAR